MMKSLREHGPLVVAIEVPDPFETADTSHVAGDWDDYRSQNLRADDEGAAPHNHHRRNPLEPVKMLEAKWELDCTQCSDCARLDDDADRVIAENMELDFP